MDARQAAVDRVEIKASVFPENYKVFNLSIHLRHLNTNATSTLDLSHQRHYPFDLSTAFCKTFGSHQERVTSLIALKNGDLVSGSADHSIHKWDIETRNFEIFKGHTDNVTAFAELPDGRLVSGSNDGTIRLWNINTKQSIFFQARNSIKSLVVLDDGRLASGHANGNIYIWDTSGAAREPVTLQYNNHQKAHSNWVTGLIMLPKGCLLSASLDRSFRLWDIANKRCLNHFDGIKEISQVVALPNGYLACGHGESIRAVGAEVLTKITTFGLGSYLDPHISVWKMHESSKGILENITKTAELKQNGATNDLAVLPNGILVSSDQSRNLQLWDVGNGNICMGSIKSYHHIEALTVLPNGDLVSGGGSVFTAKSSDQNIQIRKATWNTLKYHEIAPLLTALENNTSVTQLSLENCELRDDENQAVEALIRLSQRNRTITHINLNNTGISKDKLDLLKRNVRSGLTLQHVLLEIEPQPVVRGPIALEEKTPEVVLTQPTPTPAPELILVQPVPLSPIQDAAPAPTVIIQVNTINSTPSAPASAAISPSFEEHKNRIQSPASNLELSLQKKKESNEKCCTCTGGFCGCTGTLEVFTSCWGACFNFFKGCYNVRTNKENTQLVSGQSHITNSRLT